MIKCKLNMITLLHDRPVHYGRVYNWEKHLNKEYEGRINLQNPFHQIDIKLGKRWYTFWLRYVEIYRNGQWMEYPDTSRPPTN